MKPAICPLCEASCGLRVEVDGDRVTSVRGDPEDALSRGHLCPKAAALADLHADPDRLRHPLRRNAAGELVRVGWEEALEEIADRLHGIRSAHGRDAVGLYLGNPNVHNLGMMTFGPNLWRELKTRNRTSATSVDQLPHQLAAHLMLGHQLLLPVPDVDRTDLLVLLGANPLVSNGSLWTVPDVRKRLDALRERGGRLVVVDPRRTETAVRADEHLPIAPGADAALLLALLHVIFAEGQPRLGHLAPLIDGLDAVREVVAAWPPERVADFTGIDAVTLRTLALRIADTPRAVVHGRFGASTQDFGGLVAWLVLVLNAVTGHLDTEGGAMFAEPAFDPIHAPLGLGVGPGTFARWKSRVAGLPEFSGEPPVATLADEILEPGEGQVRAMVVWAGNPVLSTPNGARLERAFSGLDLLVCVGPMLDETARLAHFVLPPVAPLARPHYDVIFHLLAVRNTARYADPAVPPDGDLRQDWEIASHLTRGLARRRGASWKVRAQHRALAWLGPAGILDLGLRLGRHRLSLRKLRKSPSGIDLGPLRPCLPERLAPGRRVALAPAPMLADLDRLRAAVDAPRPDLVLIGRRELRSNNSWMHNAPRLMKGGDRCLLQVHPEDAARHGLVDGGRARVESRVGAVEVPVQVTDDVRPGVVCLPHGWGHARDGVRQRVAAAAGGVSVNDLTDERRIDALSGNAAFSGTPVTLRPV
ncbi:MAG: molybdopterin-dependent oxidoreductase [Myxococcales bacterium]|nr:molybdopterin-dependent oxidoreductase [Myxococcales bacterium]